MSDVAKEIQAILERRRDHLPKVEKEISRLRGLDTEVSQLELVVQELRDHPRTPPELKASLVGFQMPDLHYGIADALGFLRTIESRFSRGTINIGVSGRARVGKSTLLQGISGLTEEQIPTGKGLPVTAVRSKIYHSTSLERATLTLHSFDTFRDEVLRPYHAELGILELPASLAEFKRWPYPANVTALPEITRNEHSSVTILWRVREMQQALVSYEQDLTGGERVVDLKELRQYVAYPTSELQSSLGDKCPRRYLAVRDIRIECSFPHASVDHLGIIDLPGLGELAANAEEHHLAGLQNEVDLVLLIKRPVEGLAYWGREDGNTANLLDKARGFIKNRRDFVFLVVNAGEDDKKLAASLLDNIKRDVNEGQDGKHFFVLSADASNRKSINDNILSPVLQHLAERLPVMDNEVLEGTRAKYLSLTSRISTTLKDIEGTLANVVSVDGSSVEELDRRTEILIQDIAASLAPLISDLRPKKSDDEDPEYLSAIDSAYKITLDWISGGFGKGRDAWCSDALRTMRVGKGSGSFSEKELNRIRVEISKSYCSIDTFFQSRVHGLWTQVATIFQDHMGELVAGESGEESLKRLSKLMEEASEPCPILSDAIKNILTLRLDYRTQLHPIVREELDCLTPQVPDPETGVMKDRVSADVSEAGAEQLFQDVTGCAKKAAYEVKNALIREAITPSLVIWAAAEQFEDTLIRSGESNRDFKRLARSYRDEIWPSVFNGIDESNARIAKLKRTIRSIRDHLDGIEQGNA